MVGLPTETREEVFESIKLCKRLNSDINSVAIFPPLPSLPLTQFCIDNGYITGHEEIPDVISKSILNMPSMAKEEIEGLNRTFVLYAKLPELYWPDIEKCEKDYSNNIELFDKLVGMRYGQMVT
jgi:hypothetical protein